MLKKLIIQLAKYIKYVKINYKKVAMNGGRFVMFGKNRTAQDTLGNDRELLLQAMDKIIAGDFSLYTGSLRMLIHLWMS